MTEEKLQQEIGKEYVFPKKDDNKPVTEEIIKKLPKVELHCHLDGSMRVETILEEAERQKVKLPADNPDKLKKMVQPGFDCKSLVDYLKAFDITLSVLQEEEALYRAAYELIEDVAKENVKYIEVRYSPILHQKKGLGLVDILEAVLQGLKQGERDFGVKSGVIICGIRNIDPKYSMKLAELSVAYKNKGVVAFDLAGAEEDYPAKEHREAFQLVLKNNLNSTTHAGEAYGPESIHQAIHYCGAHRIGHGTRLFENGDLLNYVNDHRIPLEICISSNIQTKAVKRFEDHPVRLYYDLGLRITLNTDNRLVSDTTLTKEFMIAHEYYGFTLEEIKDIIIQSFKSAFIPYREKRDMLRKVIKELEKF
ncbi:adenosine deaminase [Thermotomaculum hydrothermale]|uniref:Adenosine deaminase n=1 Tax=Thermotomaculum hydrothermale TaxID=981385 RepID=A0A7R6PPA2_9BACT|nr:adenosine deaminase [Thermotomaculum hydrothermale]BBB31871.1 adenosine deaminase [Thermotomaculum hydrothermale]